MIEALEADPAIKGGFQFWTFGYSTGDPIPFSSYLFRRNLDEVRQKLDPGNADPALDRMVLVGHSMGGLLAKMIAVDSGDRLWRVVSDRPIDEMMGEADDLKLLRNGLIFDAHRGVRRVVYIATPHRGSRFDEGPIQRLGTRLIRLPDPLRAAHDRLVAQEPAELFPRILSQGSAHQHRRAGVGLADPDGPRRSAASAGLESSIRSSRFAPTRHPTIGPTAWSAMRVLTSQESASEKVVSARPSLPGSFRCHRRDAPNSLRTRGSALNAWGPAIGLCTRNNSAGSGRPRTVLERGPLELNGPGGYPDVNESGVRLQVRSSFRQLALDSRPISRIKDPGPVEEQAHAQATRLF